MVVKYSIVTPVKSSKPDRSIVTANRAASAVGAARSLFANAELLGANVVIQGSGNGVDYKVYTNLLFNVEDDVETLLAGKAVKGQGAGKVWWTPERNRVEIVPVSKENFKSKLGTAESQIITSVGAEVTEFVRKYVDEHVKSTESDSAEESQPIRIQVVNGQEVDPDDEDSGKRFKKPSSFVAPERNIAQMARVNVPNVMEIKDEGTRDEQAEDVYAKIKEVIDSAVAKAKESGIEIKPARLSVPNATGDVVVMFKAEWSGSTMPYPIDLGNGLRLEFRLIGADRDVSETKDISGDKVKDAIKKTYIDRALSLFGENKKFNAAFDKIMSEMFSERNAVIKKAIEKIIEKEFDGKFHPYTTLAGRAVLDEVDSDFPEASLKEIKQVWDKMEKKD